MNRSVVRDLIVMNAMHAVAPGRAAATNAEHANPLIDALIALSAIMVVAMIEVSLALSLHGASESHHRGLNWICVQGLMAAPQTLAVHRCARIEHTRVLASASPQKRSAGSIRCSACRPDLAFAAPRGAKCMVALTLPAVCAGHDF